MLQVIQPLNIGILNRISSVGFVPEWYPKVDLLEGTQFTTVKFFDRMPNVQTFSRTSTCKSVTLEVSRGSRFFYYISQFCG